VRGAVFFSFADVFFFFPDHQTSLFPLPKSFLFRYVAPVAIPMATYPFLFNVEQHRQQQTRRKKESNVNVIGPSCRCLSDAKTTCPKETTKHEKTSL
jgi:hypothetical protein